METRDVTDTFTRLTSFRQTVERNVADAAAAACTDSPMLLAGVNQLLEAEDSGRTHFRLLPLALHAALTGDPRPALPLVVLSRIWWAGAETLDDIADGEFDRDRIGMSPSQAMIAAIACTALIPLEVIDRAPITPAMAHAWSSEFVATSLRCADGQFDDLAAGGVPSWARTMRSYVGKTGAPYERDAVMTAQLAGEDAEKVRAWRAFGKLFGVLRQLANDHAEESPLDTADLTNGVRTLLLAHVAESARPDELATVGAHQLLVRNAVARPVLASYLARVESIASQLSALLELLAPPSEHRDVIQWLIDRSTDSVRSAQLIPA